MTYIKIIISIVVIAMLLMVGLLVTKVRSEGAELVREADRFNVPIVKQVMSELSEWNYEGLMPYVNKGFSKLFSKEEFQKELDHLSVLGRVNNITHIRHAGHKRYEHWLYSSCAVNKYSVSTEFENGKGTVVFDLNQCHKQVKVTFFQVHSKALPVRLQP